MTEAAKTEKYELDIEGKFYDWPESSITVPQLIQLAGWPAGTQVLEIDNDNNQETIAPDAVIELKPGHGYAKKHKFQRG